MPLTRMRLRTDSNFGFAESPYVPEQCARLQLRTESALGMPASPYIHSQWAGAALGAGMPGGGYGTHLVAPPAMLVVNSPVAPATLRPTLTEPAPGCPPLEVCLAAALSPLVQQIRLDSLVAAPSHWPAGASLLQAPAYVAAPYAQPVPAVTLQSLVYGGGGSASAPPRHVAAAPSAAPRVAAQGRVAQPVVLAAPNAGRTTAMLRNLPDGFTRNALLHLLDTEGFAGKYDFAYLPVDFHTLQGLKHAFVNMTSPAEADRLRSHLEGFTNWSLPSDSACAVAWNDRQQGLPALVERYRNSPVMHDTVPDECKPVIVVGGRRAMFPPPTQKIKAPKILKGKGYA